MSEVPLYLEFLEVVVGEVRQRAFVRQLLRLEHLGVRGWSRDR